LVANPAWDKCQYSHLFFIEVTYQLYSIAVSTLAISYQLLLEALVHKISKKEKINSTVTTKVDIPTPEKRFWVR
jgi:hypothetical protein